MDARPGTNIMKTFYRVSTGESKCPPTGINHARENSNLRYSNLKRQLKAKIREIKSEVSAMQDDIMQASIDERISLNYRNKAKTTAKELTTNQGILSDLFTAIDKVNTGTTTKEILAETAKLKKKNDKSEKLYEQLHLKRLKLQENVEKNAEEVSRLTNLAKPNQGNYPKNTKLPVVTIDPTTIKNNLHISLKDKNSLTKNYNKIEAAKLEQQLWILEQMRNEIMITFGVQFDSYDNKSPEDELYHIYEILRIGVVENLAKNKKYIDSLNIEQFEKYLEKIPLDDCSPKPLYRKLVKYFHQLQILNKNITGSIIQLNSKTADLKMLCTNSFDLLNLENRMGRKKMNLTNEKNLIDCRRSSLILKLNMKQDELKNYETLLTENQKFGEIRSLEIRLGDLIRINYSIKEYLDESEALRDLEDWKKRALEAVGRVNRTLMNNVEAIY